MDQQKNSFLRYAKVSYVTAFCCAALLISWAIYIQQPLFPATYRLVKIAFFFVLAVLQFKVSLWMIVMAAIIIAGVRQERRRRENVVIVNQQTQPEFLSYRKDTLIKWLWTWDYRLIPNTNDYIVSDLQPYCKNDETPLVENTDQSYFCPKCGMHYGDQNGGEYAEREDVLKIFEIVENNIKKMNNVP